MPVDERSWPTRAWRRVRAVLGPLTPPLVVLVAVLYSDGVPKGQTGLRHVGREMTAGWRVHWGS